MPVKKSNNTCGGADGGGKTKTKSKSNKKKTSGGAASVDPVVGRGATVKIATAGKPVQNSGAVWNRVAMYPSNLASQDFTVPHVINRGLVTPNKPHYTDLVTFGGGGKAKTKTKTNKKK